RGPSGGRACRIWSRAEQASITTLLLLRRRRIERRAIEQLPAEAGWQIESHPFPYRKLPIPSRASGRMLWVIDSKLEPRRTRERYDLRAVEIENGEARAIVDRVVTERQEH